jgi:hypothetical protein
MLYLTQSAWRLLTRLAENPAEKFFGRIILGKPGRFRLG